MVTTNSSEILYAVRIGNEKDGRLLFEYQGVAQDMRFKVVPKVMNISQQNPNLNLQPSDFQGDQDSTYGRELVNRSSEEHSTEMQG